MAKIYTSASILFTGHSLGGALATFAAVDVKETLGLANGLKLYTFGSPRTGNQAWGDYVMKLFPANLFRVVHGYDIVPHLPNIWEGFSHVGTEVWYPGRGLETATKTCANSAGQPENKSCSDTVGPTQVSAEDHLLYVDIDFKLKWCTNGSQFEDSAFPEFEVADFNENFLN